MVSRRRLSVFGGFLGVGFSAVVLVGFPRVQRGCSELSFFFESAWGHVCRVLQGLFGFVGLSSVHLVGDSLESSRELERV